MTNSGPYPDSDWCGGCGNCPLCNPDLAAILDAHRTKDWARTWSLLPPALRAAITNEKRELALRANMDGGVPKPPSLTDLIRQSRQSTKSMQSTDDMVSRLPEPRAVPKRRPLPERMPSPPSLSSLYRNSGGVK